MKKLSIYLSVLLLLAGVLQSCKKKEAPEVPPPTPKELLTKGMWNYTKMENYDNNGNLQQTSPVNYQKEYTVSDHYYLYDQYGNMLSYGTYTLDEESDPMKLRETNQNNVTVVYLIEELKEDKMVLRQERIGGYYLLYFER